jgi:hypothetical protein
VYACECMTEKECVAGLYVCVCERD